MQCNATKKEWYGAKPNHGARVSIDSMERRFGFPAKSRQRRQRTKQETAWRRKHTRQLKSDGFFTF
jgi:hypothetical protein